jgi:COP9 signalosome complex subunit 1
LATPDFAEGTMKGVDHSNLLTGLNCAYGLAELATRKYKSAAKRFLLAHLDHCNIPDIMSAQVRSLSSLKTPLIGGSDMNSD